MADLASVKLFKGIPDKELRSIERGVKEATHAGGKDVVVSGRDGVGFMVILDGDAEVHLPRGRTLPLGPGDVFGEMALLDQQGRSATVTAVTDLTVAAVTQWEFKEFLAEHPTVAWRLLQTLSERLREAQAE